MHTNRLSNLSMAEEPTRHSEIAALNHFIRSLDLVYFDPEEFTWTMEEPLNGPPPRRIWGNIVPTLMVLDRTRDIMGAPITVTSCYRKPSYNQREGGSPRSQHQAFTAVDFVVRGKSPHKVAQFLNRVRGRIFTSPVIIRRTPVEIPTYGSIPYLELDTSRQGFGFTFRGGVKAYPNFLHLDTRGYDVTW